MKEQETQLIKQQSQSFRNIIEQFLQPISKSTGSQMLMAIKNDKNFDRICQCLDWVLSDSQEGLITLDKDYINMKICSKLSENASQNRQASSTKLQKAVERLQQLEMKMDCLIEQLKDKTQWIKQKTLQYEKTKESAKQDCEILAHQNKKLQKQMQQKQNISHGNEPLKNSNKNSEELQTYLKKFKCQESGFPKNKNQANRLLNNLEVLIQRLQIQKLNLS